MEGMKMGWTSVAYLSDIKQECLTEEGIRKTNEMKEEEKYDIEHPFKTKWVPRICFSIIMTVVIIGSGTIIYSTFLRVI